MIVISSDYRFNKLTALCIILCDTTIQVELLIVALNIFLILAEFVLRIINDTQHFSRQLIYLQLRNSPLPERIKKSEYHAYVWYYSVHITTTEWTSATRGVCGEFRKKWVKLVLKIHIDRSIRILYSILYSQHRWQSALSIL